MNISLTTADKLLIVAIIIVASAIVGSLYWGVQMIQDTLTNTNTEDVLVKENLEKDEVDMHQSNTVDLSLEQKLQILDSLKTGQGTQTKQSRLDFIKQNKVSGKESNTLTLEQKMDILSGL